MNLTLLPDPPPPPRCPFPDHGPMRFITTTADHAFHLYKCDHCTAERHVPTEGRTPMRPLP